MIQGKHLLVTLSDENYLDKAKQLFSSVYHNAGWKGDYMLLTHEIPENKLDWFRNKGILIYKCKPLYSDIIGMGYNPVILDKLYLFTDHFKKWDRIIFLDSDIIVKASLDKLTQVNQFAAADSSIKLGKQFTDDGNLYNEIRANYNLNKKSFNTGLFVLPGKIISENMFNEILKLYRKYQHIADCNEEAILNLYFYDKWKLLPGIYNYFVSVQLFVGKKHDRIKAIVYHFIKIIGHDKNRPWHPENVYHQEWAKNLKDAEKIDISRPREIKEWSSLKIRYNSFLLRHIAVAGFEYKYIFKLINLRFHRLAGKTGVFIKARNIKLYYLLKKLKGD